MKIPYHIAIEGTIGVGKTSLAGILGDRLEAKLILEEFEENPFLVEFYKDSDRFAFQTQLFFLLSRYRQQQQLQQTDLFTKTLISDYMFVKDRLFAALNLDDKEMSLYNSVARILEKSARDTGRRNKSAASSGALRVRIPGPALSWRQSDARSRFIARKWLAFGGRDRRGRNKRQGRTRGARWF